MKEKLLAALKTKFQGVQDSILDRQAEKLAKTVTEEDAIETAVSGVTFETLLQAETDRRATEATQTAVKNYEKKHNLKDGKPVEEPGKKADPDPSKGDDDIPTWAKSLREQNEALQKTISGLTKGQELSQKRSQALKILEESKIIDKEDRDYYAGLINYESETPIEDQIKIHEEKLLESTQRKINQSVDGEGKTGGTETSDAEVDDYLDEKFPKQE